MFQYPEYQLFEETVYRDIAFGPKNMGLIRRRDPTPRARAAHSRGYDALLEKSPFDLSGGQKRRVAIAGVIAMEPEVLILDEPTRAWTPQAARASLQISATIRRRARHRRDGEPFAWRRSRNVDRMLVLNQGTTCMTGTPREVFSHAATAGEWASPCRRSRAVPALRERGVPWTRAFTVEQARQELGALQGGRGPC